MCETLMPYIYGLACYIILQVVKQSFIIMFRQKFKMGLLIKIIFIFSYIFLTLNY